METIFEYENGYNRVDIHGNAAGVRIKTSMIQALMPWEEIRGLVRALGQAYIEHERSQGRLPIKREGAR